MALIEFIDKNNLQAFKKVCVHTNMNIPPWLLAHTTRKTPIWMHQQASDFFGWNKQSWGTANNNYSLFLSEHFSGWKEIKSEQKPDAEATTLGEQTACHGMEGAPQSSVDETDVSGGSTLGRVVAKGCGALTHPGCGSPFWRGMRFTAMASTWLSTAYLRTN